MAWIFIIADPEGRLIGLSEEGWRHIQKHPGVTEELIRTTIEQADHILRNDDHGSLNYIRRIPETRFFRMVAAKSIDSRRPEYGVSTAYPKAIPPGGRRIWTRPLKP